MKEQELNIQWSSTTLANSKEGPTEAGATLLTGLLSNESYTETVFDKAQTFEEETKKHFPDATFGVSILPTMMNKESLIDFSTYLKDGSIDIPYIINWLNLPQQKAKEVIAREGIGLKGALEYGFEIAYAMMQARSKSNLKKRLQDSLEKFPTQSPITMRTCIENFSNPKVLRVVNELSEKNKNVEYALEPNPKLVNTLPEYISYIDQLIQDNPNLKIGLDLDLTHLKDEQRNLMLILDTLEGSKYFPLILSLGGNILSKDNSTFTTHLPLNLQDQEVVKNLGEYYSHLRFRNRQLPSLLFETSPAEQGLFESYRGFLQSFKKGYQSPSLPSEHIEIFSEEN